MRVSGEKGGRGRGSGGGMVVECSGPKAHLISQPSPSRSPSPNLNPNPSPGPNLIQRGDEELGVVPYVARLRQARILLRDGLENALRDARLGWG